MAHVSAIHKKGHVDLCENYRPISLLNLGYKVFAALVRSRLVEGGAEARLSETQFGFRSGCSTVDAIFILRRLIDQSWAQRDGGISALALDWQKAFASIDPGAMSAALERFGLPRHVLEAIYSDRCFQVRDCDHLSTVRPQHAGISQGCPLSPFLFVMLMSVLMKDAVDRLPEGDKDLLREKRLAELLYADDTLLLGVSSGSLQRFLEAVSDAGAAYGLELHMGKLQLLNVRCDVCLRTSDHVKIEPRSELTYLGTVISADGRLHKELGRRLGMASSEFRALSRLWRHSSLGRRRKVQILAGAVFTKLLYGLAAAWLNVSERRRINGFQNRCLRSIWGIKPAYWSRVSNAKVLEITGQQPLTRSLERQQLLLYGKAARQKEGSLMRESAFCPGSLRPATDRYVRKVGRPRVDWTTEVQKLAIQAAGVGQRLEEVIQDAGAWKSCVDTFCNR